jgi:hypothetical protein
MQGSPALTPERSAACTRCVLIELFQWSSATLGPLAPRLRLCCVCSDVNVWCCVNPHARNELGFQSSACGQRRFHTIVHQQVITIYAACSVLHVHALPGAVKLLLFVRCFKFALDVPLLRPSVAPLNGWLLRRSVSVCRCVVALRVS